jgi:hypothetical protein
VTRPGCVQESTGNHRRKRMTDEKMVEVRAALDAAIKEHGEPDGQELQPKAYAVVLEEVAKKCDVRPYDVLEVNRARWRERQPA